MFEELLIPLLLSEALGRINGKTRLQKLVYIVQKEANNCNVQASSFNYELYYYGPFSSELSATLENLKETDLIEETTEMTPSGYTRYVYSITDKGRKLLEDAKEKKLLSKKLEKIVKEVAKDFGHLELPELVKEAYRRFSN
jgi:uncharacterized protein YwgA